MQPKLQALTHAPVYECLMDCMQKSLPTLPLRRTLLFILKCLGESCLQFPQEQGHIGQLSKPQTAHILSRLQFSDNLYWRRVLVKTQIPGSYCRLSEPEQVKTGPRNLLSNPGMFENYSFRVRHSQNQISAPPINSKSSQASPFISPGSLSSTIKWHW